MMWVLAALAVAVIGVAAVAANGMLGELPPVVDDRPAPEIPATGELTGQQVRALQFAVVPRGYAMEQVDAVLDRVARQIDTPPQPGAPQPGHGHPYGEPAPVEQAATAPLRPVDQSPAEPLRTPDMPAPQPHDGAAPAVDESRVEAEGESNKVSGTPSHLE